MKYMSITMPEIYNFNCNWVGIRRRRAPPTFRQCHNHKRLTTLRQHGCRPQGTPHSLWQNTSCSETDILSTSVVADTVAGPRDMEHHVPNQGRAHQQWACSAHGTL